MAADGGVRREEPQLDLRLAEDRALGGHDDVAGDGGFHAAAEAGTVNGGDGGHLLALDQLEHAVEGSNHGADLIGLVVGDFHPRAPARAFTGNDHALDFPVGLERFKCCDQLLHHVDVEDVVLGPGEGNPGDSARCVEFEKIIIGHGAHP